MTPDGDEPDVRSFHDAPRDLHWPDGLDEAGFLERHWQRAPLLMRQALPGFESPLSADELAGLALEADTTPRLISRGGNGAYVLEHGPFDEDVFARLGTRDWSLLVTDVEKHLPELAVWLDPFRIAPDWRLDDLMVSFAPDGASVGAHVDEYDVFLLQASGTRRWSIDARDGVEHASTVDGDLRLVADFRPGDTWDLAPGDVLYLPPGVPHHGVAVGDGCTTWSIGFRAPSAADVVGYLAERIAERLASTLPQPRLTDGARGRGRPGEIGDDAIEAVERLWRTSLELGREELVALTGELLTRSGTGAEAEDVDERDGVDRRDDAARVSPPLAVGDTLDVAPFTRLAWSGRGVRVRLFANGESLDCSTALARRLCDGGGSIVVSADAESGDRATLVTLLEHGALVRGD